MIKTNLLDKSSVRSVVVNKGPFSVIEYERDISTSPSTAHQAYFASMMNIRKRQLVAEIKYPLGVVAQTKAMQIMLGDVNVTTDIRGIGDMVKKIAGSAVSNESAIKPKYSGNGKVIFEPTYKYILLENVSDWDDGIVLEDGMFLACEDSVRMKIVSRNTVSSIIFGKEGLFNLELYGDGYVALESQVPAEEIIVVDLVDDVIKIDGNMAIAWSPGLKFSVQKTTSTLVGSVASGEGLVNVYEGTGRIMIAPVRNNCQKEEGGK